MLAPMMSLPQAASQHSQQLEALHSQQRSQNDRHLEHTRSQLTDAFQRELAIQQRQCEQLEQVAEDRLEEGVRLQAALAERDEQVRFLTIKHKVGRSVREGQQGGILGREVSWAGESSLSKGV